MEDFAMIPAKEAKDMLYKMLSENFMSLQVATALEVPNSKLAATGEHPGEVTLGPQRYCSHF